MPTVFGLFAGAGLGLSDMIMEALLKLAPTAALLFFAITFFGIMIDVGSFDPLIRLILRFVKNDPMRLVVGTALLTSIVSRDGDGSTTFTDAENHLHRPKGRPNLVWLNFTLTAAVMVMLVWGLVEPPVILMVGAGLALVMNFPRVAAQSEQIKAHAASVVSVVALVFAASVLTGVLNGTGMVDAMATWLVDIIPTSFGPHLATIAGALSLPLTFFMSNDAFFFGVLPVLTKAASHYGITAEEMARASIIGQPLHQSSPLVASFLLLVGLAKVELGDHMRKAIWRACVVGLVMLTVGILTTAYPF